MFNSEFLKKLDYDDDFGQIAKESGFEKENLERVITIALFIFKEELESSVSPSLHWNEVDNDWSLDIVDRNDDHVIGFFNPIDYSESMFKIIDWMLHNADNPKEVQSELDTKEITFLRISNPNEDLFEELYEIFKQHFIN